MPGLLPLPTHPPAACVAPEPNSPGAWKTQPGEAGSSVLSAGEGRRGMGSAPTVPRWDRGGTDFLLETRSSFLTPGRTTTGEPLRRDHTF